MPIDKRPESYYIGKPESFDLLYQTGLGSKNAQGFGMFDIIDE